MVMVKAEPVSEDAAHEITSVNEIIDMKYKEHEVPAFGSEDRLFMDMIKEEASIHEAPSEMSTLNDECFTVIKSEGDHGAVAPTGDKKEALECAADGGERTSELEDLCAKGLSWM